MKMDVEIQRSFNGRELSVEGERSRQLSLGCLLPPATVRGRAIFLEKLGRPLRKLWIRGIPSLPSAASAAGGGGISGS
jgi:hypothetical protein